MIDKQKYENIAKVNNGPHRPFANAEEFKSNRDRWIKHKSVPLFFRVSMYNDFGVDDITYGKLFEFFEFDDNLGKIIGVPHDVD